MPASHKVTPEDRPPSMVVCSFKCLKTQKHDVFFKFFVLWAALPLSLSQSP